MDFLAKDVIMSEAAKVKPGTIARIGYRTSLPVKAHFKKQGIEIIKFTETSVRLGVSYHRIAEVIARKAEKMLQTTRGTSNYQWVLKNKVRHNTATSKYYLYVAHFNAGHHTKSMYLVLDDFAGEMMSKEEFLSSPYKHCIIDSYWKGNETGKEVKNISFENIYKINSSGVSMFK